MRGVALIAAGCAVLAFAAHMTLHMTVVGIGVPLVAIGLASRLPPMLGLSPAFAAIMSVLDLAVVWGWHAPALHHASRGGGALLALEQGMFAVVTLGLWLAAVAGPALAGALALFMTSMHMTLLGALLGLGGRSLFPAHDGAVGAICLSPVEDQQLGGAIMLGVGGAVYLAAGLWLVGRLLRRPAPS